MTDWNVEEAKDTIRNGGLFGAKRVMEAVYRNNIDVFRHWGYRLPDGKLVGLGDRNALQIKIATFLPHSSYSRTSARPLRARMPFTTQTIL